MSHQAESSETETEFVGIPGTAIKMSRVAIGTWAIGGWMWGGTEETESVSTIRTALDHGINLIDTAPPISIIDVARGSPGALNSTVNDRRK
jgi:hypothetical protein